MFCWEHTQQSEWLRMTGSILTPEWSKNQCAFIAQPTAQPPLTHESSFAGRTVTPKAFFSAPSAIVATLPTWQRFCCWPSRERKTASTDQYFICRLSIYHFHFSPPRVPGYCPSHATTRFRRLSTLWKSRLSDAETRLRNELLSR